MNLRDNNIMAGLVTGILVPILAYGVWTLLFNLLTSLEVMDPTGFSESWRLRTIALLAISMNIIPFNLHKKMAAYGKYAWAYFPDYFICDWMGYLF